MGYLSLGNVYKLFDANAAAAPVASDGYGIHPNDRAKVIVWSTKFASAPTACSIVLQGSLNGTDWYTLDTSTATAGEIRTTGVTASPWLRANKASQTGGGALTVEVLIAV
jgi:hypothetical protein